MGVRLFVLSLLVFVLLTVSVSAGCYEDGALVCGSTPDSALGLGAVDICGVCYPCGAADGVCPEDFYGAGVGQGSCKFCSDPDCLVEIDGVVEDTDSGLVSGADVMVLYINNDVAELVATTDGSGYYRGFVRSGHHRFFVRYEDYDSHIIEEDVERLSTGVVKTINFDGSSGLEPGTCSPQCTDVDGDRCKASCNGINGCVYANFTIATLCDDKLIGSTVFLDDENYITCCQGTVTGSRTADRLDADVGFAEDFAGEDVGGVENLVTFVQRARSAGERVDIHISVWDVSEE